MGVQSQFYDHEVVLQSPDDYVEMHLAPADILRAWASSMFSYEVLNKDGSVKATDDMVDETLERYVAVQDRFKRGESIAKPVIGIGIMDTIEIGIGREIVAAAHIQGLDLIPVHVRKAQAEEIKSFL